jgi:hypothetical protein
MTCGSKPAKEAAICTEKQLAPGIHELEQAIMKRNEKFYAATAAIGRPDLAAAALNQPDLIEVARNQAQTLLEARMLSNAAMTGTLALPPPMTPEQQSQLDYQRQLALQLQQQEMELKQKIALDRQRTIK